jgi:DNA-binding NarL/FixJ family response regulator
VVRLSTPRVGVGRIEEIPVWAENHYVSPTVLIVDDHAAFRALARRLLEADGYEVVGEATDGQTGLNAADSLRPDVVLLDVRLPDMDGFQVACHLVAGGSTAAIVVTSSSDDPLYPERATRNGARGFVAKHDVCGAALDRLLGSPA